MLEHTTLTGDHSFYTEIPRTPGSKSFTNARHFILLPDDKTVPREIRKHFTANQNSRAANEIEA